MTPAASGRRAAMCCLLLCCLSHVTGVFAADDSVQPGELTPLELPTVAPLRPVAVGEPGPEFRLKDVDGRGFDFGPARRERVHLLVFWSIFSPPSRKQLPVLQRLHERYRSRGLEVVGVAVDGEAMRQAIPGVAGELGLSFRIFLDPAAPDDTLALTTAYGVRGVPMTCLIDRGGRVLFVRSGWTPEGVLEEAVRNALPE